MQAWIISVIERFGYLGVFLMIALENIFPPIPSEIILTFSGFMTVTTEMSIVAMIISATLGSVVGAIILYLLGSLLGVNRVQGLVKRHGSILRLRTKDIQKSLLFYDRYKNSTVFFCRMVPILRSLISIPAGMAKMSFSTFLILTASGSLIWNTALIFLGAFMNTAWQSIASAITVYSDITLVVLIVTLAVFVMLFLYIKSPKSKQVLSLFLATDQAEKAQQIFQKNLERFNNKNPHHALSEALSMFKAYYYEFESGSYKKMLKNNNPKIILNKLDIFLNNYFKLINLKDIDIYMARYLPTDYLLIIFLALNDHQLMQNKQELMRFYYKMWYYGTPYGQQKKISQKILKKIKSNNINNLLNEFSIINLNNNTQNNLLDLDYCSASLLYIYYRQNSDASFIEDDKKLHIHLHSKGKQKKSLDNLNLMLEDRLLISDGTQKQAYFKELYEG